MSIVVEWRYLRSFGIGILLERRHAFSGTDYCCDSNSLSGADFFLLVVLSFFNKAPGLTLKVEPGLSD